MKIENKKGEITTKQIVTLIILIVSFVIILFLLFRLNLGRATDKEICHNSVVLKSAGKGLVGQLDCKTNYLCISGGNDCEGISPTETVKINLNKEDDVIKKEIMKVIADEMADCWWMFGEGELDYMRGNFLGNTACAICSIVKFDNKIQESQEEGITYEEFMEFLANETKSKNEKNTYLYYLYGVSSIDGVLEKYSVIKNDYELKKKISLKDKYMIRTGQVKPGFISKLDLFNLFKGAQEEIYIVPYFFDMNNIPEPECDEFITKA